MKYNILSLGSDPELPVFDIEQNKFVSVENMIKDGDIGTKNNPMLIKDGFYLQEDGTNVEFNTKPALTKQEWIDNHKFMLDTINVFLPDNVVTKVETTVKIDWEELGTEQTMEAGCEADYNFWTKSKNSKPKLSKINKRFAAGHIHVGYESPTLEKSSEIVKRLDILVGIPSIILDPDNQRRNYYGKVGSARPKVYGLEWRVPSNFWLKNEELMTWMYDNVVEAINTEIPNIDQYYEDVKDIINNTNIEKAYTYCDKFNINIEKVKV